ncbi:double-strand break repair protein AddB [Chelativorans sp. AA-79]|uniref:double-strand break repair protein AddB n=1 Tax=Chelativorans sp. AA-79 TaxID=3028735 RepID=UPI0023F6F449|nr:double-strand break repair protein AddB [Chelativorans sp. AA-79]WEX09433.1 double-strand break repair protein AddB [Chelativorans sp. AA-79]
MSTGTAEPRVFSIPPGVPFLPALAEALLEGRLVPGFRYDGNPLALADATIYLPTRRAARELRSVLVDRLGGVSAILPVIRPLGEFQAEIAEFGTEGGAAVLDHTPPISKLDRILLLGRLAQAWKARVPAHVAARFEEGVVVPASVSDGLWLARDLSALMDEIETEGADWNRLAELVPQELAGWWQVTLEFLAILTRTWPEVLAERGQSNPAAHRNAMLAAEAERLLRNPPRGPIVAAGSTGSIPATARLLGTIARLGNGAVVLPGLDLELDEASWRAIDASEEPSACGHPQFGLRKLITTMGMGRGAVKELSTPAPVLAARHRLLSEALRPAETTDLWAVNRQIVDAALAQGALAGVSLVEAANERDEAAAIAVALRRAAAREGATAALVTPDRALARRVAAELRRFGIRADDSGGSFLADSVPATLLRLALEAICRPKEPVVIVGLLKHPLLRLGLSRETIRRAAEIVELVALRGGTGRPDVTNISSLFEERLATVRRDMRKPFWLNRLTDRDLSDARQVLARFEKAIEPLAKLRGERAVALSEIARASVEAAEALARDNDGAVTEFYRGESGEALARFLREVVESRSGTEVQPAEWPDVFSALMAGEVVTPAMGSDHRVAIWGTLEARLQSVDVLVLGGLNEGTWPEAPPSDRFMSRLMKGELQLEPPERRIGLAAHDFMMALGAPEVVLARSTRVQGAPAVASRWLQRLTACSGLAETAAMRARGLRFIAWAHALEAKPDVPFARRPCPKPPLEARPQRFSITEIETMRRDPYAVYARRILRLSPLDPLIRDPGAAERGTLFHDILQAFVQSGADPTAPDALERLIDAGRRLFAKTGLPVDVEAVWWPRFERTAHGVISWERTRAEAIATRHAEIRASAIEVGATGTLLSGRADRIDIRTDGRADIIDYKTGSNPSKVQAHRLLAPQLALEAALLARGAFAGLGNPQPADLCYVRLKANGSVEPESILRIKDSEKTGARLAEEAWQRLEKLLVWYGNSEAGYLSRPLPFKEGDTEGDYDHLARVLEWSAGGDTGEGDA